MTLVLPSYAHTHALRPQTLMIILLCVLTAQKRNAQAAQSNGLPNELVVDGLDTEQIWQQLQLAQMPLIDRIQNKLGL